MGDSVAMHREARRAQEQFERFREVRIPAERRGGGGGAPCDEPIGRLCLNFPSGDPAPIGAPPREVVEARSELLDLLSVFASAIPGDDWIAGQRVRYMVEAGDLLGASQAVDQCRAQGWWCEALRGWVAHERDEWVVAGEHFLDALESMPEGEAERWTGEDWIMEREGRAFLDASDPQERERRRALLWRLADPLFLAPGNDRWTEHMSRLTQVRTLEDAWNAFGLPWDEDLEQILMRYGWSLGWERRRSAPSFDGRTIQENRMTGRLDPDRRRYMPMGEALRMFPDNHEGALDTRGGRQSTGYTAPYARTFENLSSQTGRFLRDGELFVVHAFARGPRPADDAVAGERVVDPFGTRDAMVEAGDRSEPLPRDLRTALFLLPVDGPVIEEGPRPAAEGEGIEGVWTATVPRGDLILSLEAWSRFESKAWRVRHGLPDLPGSEGSLTASDPILLDAEPLEEPASLEEAMEHMLATTRLRSGDRMRIGWEVYGIPEGEIASVSLGLEEAERSAIRRIGEFFRVLEPTEPATIRWDDAEAERPGTVFRTVDLQLPLLLSPGSYDLILEIRLGDEPPAVARRRFHIDP
jgi:hypothetical protein